MLLSIQNMEVRYGQETALHITSPITISEGDRIGVIGSNGAGKTTLIKSILGLVNYQGSILTNLAPEQIAVHMQFNEYTDAMPVKYVMEAILATRISQNPRLQELIRYFEFETCLKKKFSKLSGGQKQRFTIIMVMMQEAPLTFYDEVTSGLDFETRQKLVEKLANWYQGKTASLLIVSHYYEELELLADKLLILDKGRVIDFGYRNELFQKYCGKSVIIIDHTPENEALINDFKRITAPAHLIAISCQGSEDEQKITELLIHNNINYKRSNRDIEMIYMNAKENDAKKEGTIHAE